MHRLYHCPQDRQAEAAVCHCHRCGGEIYYGERYYLLWGYAVCVDCFPQYMMEEHSRDCRRAGEETEDEP